jgi:hypothetical protein
MTIWQTIRSATFNRHSHRSAYAAVVLSGGYEEAGDHGRLRAHTGDAVLHDAFESHTNRFFGSSTVVLNLHLPQMSVFTRGLVSIANPDAIFRLAERSKREAVELLLSTNESRMTAYLDWPDPLAIALIRNPCLSLSQWSITRGIPPWTISRSFRQVFGIAPSAFRA